MLLELHEKYTIAVLSQIDNIDEKIATEILKGSFVNDLCELTDGYTKIKNTLKKYLKKKKEKGLVDYSAFYQSHWGELSCFHCMASAINEDAITTQNTIFSWLSFLEFIIFNVDESILEKKINKFQNILGSHVSELKFQISSLLDTHSVLEAKYRAIGMIIHMIEDSYTVSHCKRKNSDIMSFHYYSAQTATIHKKYDEILPEDEKKMLSDINDVLTQLLNEHSANSNYQEIFKISTSALPSSDGGFV